MISQALVDEYRSGPNITILQAAPALVAERPLYAGDVQQILHLLRLALDHLRRQHQRRGRSFASRGAGLAPVTTLAESRQACWQGQRWVALLGSQLLEVEVMPAWRDLPRHQLKSFRQRMCISEKYVRYIVGLQK